MARAFALVLAVVAALPAVAEARERFDTRVFALTPRPGFPAQAYVGPNRRVHEGTYTNPSGDSMPSRVFEYSPEGAQPRSWTIRGQDLSGDHGVQVAAMDAKRRLMLLDKAPPRVIRLHRNSGRQTVYARFPDGAIPNFAAWGRDGSLYVTDYEGATIWRVPPGAGTPQVWVKDAALDGGPFGLTGIRLAADRRTLVVAMQSQAGLGAGDPSAGRMVTIPIGPDGKPGPVKPLWESQPFDGPDGFGIARSGRIYISLLVARTSSPRVERNRKRARPDCVA